MLAAVTRVARHETSGGASRKTILLEDRNQSLPVGISSQRGLNLGVREQPVRARGSAALIRAGA
jgi:hypothetical protein